MHRLISRAHHSQPMRPYHRGHRRNFGFAAHHLWARPDGSEPVLPDCLLIGLIIAGLVLLFLMLPALRHIQLLNPDKLAGTAAILA